MTVDADEGAGAEGRDDMTVKHTAASEQIRPGVVCGLCMCARASDHKYTGMASLPIAMVTMHCTVYHVSDTHCSFHLDTQEQCAQYWPGNSEGLVQVGAYMMQVETEVVKESGLVLREVTLTNLKVRRVAGALEHKVRAGVEAVVLTVLEIYTIMMYMEYEVGAKMAASLMKSLRHSIDEPYFASTQPAQCV